MVKNIPYLILLSYICAELCVRFVYDSIYIPIKKKQSLWSMPVAESDESAFAKYYVTRLFRTTPRTEVERSRIKKFFNSIYRRDDDFRFPTIIICTYTTVIVFTYYLVCTWVLPILSESIEHPSLIRYLNETTFNIGKRAYSFACLNIFCLYFKNILR